MRFKDPPQVGHPEALVPPGTKRCPDGVFKHLVHPEEGEDARLEVRHSHLPGGRPSLGGTVCRDISYFDDIIIPTLIRHDNVFLLNLSVIIFSL